MRNKWLAPKNTVIICLLVKIVSENEQYKMPESIPYDGARPMYLVENVDSKEKLAEIVEATVKGLPYSDAM